MKKYVNIPDPSDMPQSLAQFYNLYPQCVNNINNTKIMNTLKLGWTGLGNMENPMVINLHKAGLKYPFSIAPKRKKSHTVL